MTKRLSAGGLCVVLVVVLAGCRSDGPPAPVSERGIARGAAVPSAASGKTYVVQPGDTLFSIAFNNGIDYRELAAINGIQDPSMIRVGQELRLSSSPAVGQVTAPARTEETRLPPAVTVTPLPPPTLTQPKVAKLPYSDKALAQMTGAQPSGSAPAAAPPASTVAAPAAAASAPPVAAGGDELNWGLPTDGKLIAGFSESAGRKGVEIAGKMGQPVSASAAGKVVYVGSGLRGYGKLVIIKHNNTYLSAYAHNNQILVKEGQDVSKGQKIAEMGNSDADQVKLHFEIRKQGKPVDPMGYLPKF
ncbi:MAG: peptidoglycan DD-metalloendopeptidase family protein [Gallionellaceae bacterium]|jgi:lipoprotein NlpD|nr:peptidoglycan DD-metalloendopeptidase family protein [Gallionellaceae bacterium]